MNVANACSCVYKVVVVCLCSSRRTSDPCRVMNPLVGIKRCPRRGPVIRRMYNAHNDDDLHVKYVSPAPLLPPIPLAPHVPFSVPTDLPAGVGLDGVATQAGDECRRRRRRSWKRRSVRREPVPIGRSCSQLQRGRRGGRNGGDGAEAARQRQGPV